MHCILHVLFFYSMSIGIVRAATVTYNFNLTWVTANPDGAFERPTIGINGNWPLPAIEATIGDSVVVNVENQLGNQSSSLHFHGLFMNGSTQYDGPAGVSQCSIPPGSLFTYEFTIRQPGTYWYHAHAHGQYPDGLRGPLIVHDPESPYRGNYDQEYVLTLSDWYHEQMPDLISSFMNVANPMGAEPIPNAALMNDTQNLTLPVAPDTTYMFRVINMGAFAAQYLWFEGHMMYVIEVDGVYTEPKETAMIYITPAQRYTVLVTTMETVSGNFPIIGSMDTTLFDNPPESLNPNVTGWLVYDSKAQLPAATPLETFDALDDYTLVPQDGLKLYDEVDYSMELNFQMGLLDNGLSYAFINNSTYVSPKVPTLYTALSTGANATNPAIYGSNTNAFLLEQGQTIQIVLNSYDPGKHPFHLHGHNFQAVWRGAPNAGPYTYDHINSSNTNTNSTPSTTSKTLLPALPAIPMRRDTFVINANSNIVLRFRSDNPGVWLFHCHIEWHIDSGLVATMIEAPLALQAQNLNLPSYALDACAAQGSPIAGNAAGNTVDVFDLTGENGPPADPLPEGFTTSGIVALAFSCLSAVLGLVTVVWYGAGEYGKQPQQGVVLKVDVPVPGTATTIGVTNPAAAAATAPVSPPVSTTGGTAASPTQGLRARSGV